MRARFDERLVHVGGGEQARRSRDVEGTAETATGHGLSTNIIEASLEAYLAALEKLLWQDARPSGAEVGAGAQQA